ncbi:related to nucleoside transporter [Phialocephala subalpina]|uniref:Related to nucleoside transporter n=1 Tax=Phialocephala subalpina TaxID=576137 RepID=A0A1L7XQK0_9HELO|nr:related to nucleoside transporter [Phialocephala subalpina]
MASTKAPEVKEQGLSSPELGSDLDILHGETSSEEDTKPSTGILGRLIHWEEWLDQKMGVEPHGAQRITPDKKKPPKTWMMFFMWSSSGVYTLSSITTGMIPWEYGLSLTQAILIVVFGTLVGAGVAGWCATLGPATGLRQVAISRYSFGWWPSKIIAILNIIEQIGWASVSCITGGQALSAVSNYSVSVVLGIVIINIVSIVLSFGGYTAIVKIENYFWIVFFVIFLVMYGEVGGKADLKTPAEVSGMTFSGNVLSCIAIFYGDGASYASIISDYYVNYPADISKVKVWLLTTFGIFIPVTFGILLGCLVGSTTGVDVDWADAYDNHGVGGLILAMLYPKGFAKFLLVLLSLGGVGLNVIAIYSTALAVQQAAKPLQRVPRFIWSLVTFACILVLSIGGRDKIFDFLENFLSLLGYYNTAFVAILAMEHYYFRKGNLANYDLDGWNTPSKLPIGVAGLTSFLLGIVGAILGMVETYYVGVIAKMIGDDGGDIGNELALVSAREKSASQEAVKERAMLNDNAGSRGAVSLGAIA